MEDSSSIDNTLKSLSLNESASDHEERASHLKKVLQNLLTPEAAQEVVDSEEFHDILVATIQDTVTAQKALSLMIFTKAYELLPDKEKIQKMVREIIDDWLDSTKSEVKVRAYRLLGVAFQVSPELGGALFNRDGFLAEIMDLSEFDSEKVQESLVEMLSYACTDKTCRNNVAIHCADFLKQLLVSGVSQKLKSYSAVVLSKLLFVDKNLAATLLKDSKLLRLFITIILDAEMETVLKTNAIEGLSYLTLQKAKYKQEIAENPALLKALGAMAKKETNTTVQYGVAVILTNLTNYKPRLSEEQKQMMKLKRLAKENEKQESEPENEEEFVEKRIRQVLQSDGISTLVTIAKNTSPNIRQLVARVFLNIATKPENRGLIVQGGGVRVLLSIGNSNEKQASAIASHALAKIAITMDPTVAFRDNQIYELVRLFVQQCKGESQLGQFESLLALTNITSISEQVRERVVKANGMEEFENLMFSDHEMVRRAATETMCNMMMCQSVYEVYCSKGSENKRKVLLALSDVEDFATRRAASGAIAILSNEGDVCRWLADDSRTFEILSDLIKPNESPELQHRGVECLKNIAKTDKECAQKMIKSKTDVVARLKLLVQASKVQPIVMTAVEALKAINAYGLSL
ncbi:ARM repeat-containing protein [Basidiobolus meristosporus CBS 931.73]|uniref:ARM repeat-containing protein n=1 Tax=Basidiobolus meristosporus CBS 931.73 TaxID=1314790 RepID=A0A1Y1YMV8_9FUNG|nr:ARM repeat-containing protein [Basidiobolus meristosporus CBS 931.73]|eukprot:ORX98894.1 ARM repeat-containing protein [Basidiobolus meristosporus CBS 931.73]